METVKFTEPYDKYNTSEVAGFSDEKAKELVDSGVAQYYPRKKVKQKPEVDKMVKNEDTESKQADKLTLDDLESKPGGWYEFPNGETVRGKDNAKEMLEVWNEEG